MAKPLQEFIASMNKSGGFARTARYAVRIIPPANLERLANETSPAGPAGSQTAFDKETFGEFRFVPLLENKN